MLESEIILAKRVGQLASQLRNEELQITAGELTTIYERCRVHPLDVQRNVGAFVKGNHAAHIEDVCWPILEVTPYVKPVEEAPYPHPLEK